MKASRPTTIEEDNEYGLKKTSVQEGNGDCDPVQEGNGDCGPVQEGNGDCDPVQEGNGDCDPVQEGNGDCGPVQEGNGDCDPVQEGNGGRVQMSDGSLIQEGDGGGNNGPILQAEGNGGPIQEGNGGPIQEGNGGHRLVEEERNANNSRNTNQEEDNSFIRCCNKLNEILKKEEEAFEETKQESQMETINETTLLGDAPDTSDCMVLIAPNNTIATDLSDEGSSTLCQQEEENSLHNDNIVDDEVTLTEPAKIDDSADNLERSVSSNVEQNEHSAIVHNGQTPNSQMIVHAEVHSTAIEMESIATMTSIETENNYCSIKKEKMVSDVQKYNYNNNYYYYFYSCSL